MLNRPLPRISPRIAGASRVRSGLVGAPQRSAPWSDDLEDERLIDGTEGAEARRQRPASGGASPAREAARVWSRTRRRRVGLGRCDSGRWLFRWAGPYPTGRIRIRHSY